MIFACKHWERFCKALAQEGRRSTTAESVLQKEVDTPYLVLKHDVETAVEKAFRMAEIEHRHGHKSTYYVQAYLLKNPKNIDLLQKMQAMGHEISYHYDVLDSAKGDYSGAAEEFRENLELFRAAGFPVSTVCQHGNPVVERVGYHSNRDFFRHAATREAYPQMADIMVDFPQKAGTQYLYFSDAGRIFQLIFDPFTNDIVPSDEKNTPFRSMDALLQRLLCAENCILSTHPHRWESSAALCILKNALFKVVRFTAKLLIKFPPVKKIMSRYYHLAKKI